jgi:hypothetical protein
MDVLLITFQQDLASYQRQFLIKLLVKCSTMLDADKVFLSLAIDKMNLEIFLFPPKMKSESF